MKYQEFCTWLEDTKKIYAQDPQAKNYPQVMECLNNISNILEKDIGEIEDDVEAIRNDLKIIIELRNDLLKKQIKLPLVKPSMGQVQESLDINFGQKGDPSDKLFLAPKITKPSAEEFFSSLLEKREAARIQKSIDDNCRKILTYAISRRSEHNTSYENKKIQEANDLYALLRVCKTPRDLLNFSLILNKELAGGLIKDGQKTKGLIKNDPNSELTTICREVRENIRQHLKNDLSITFKFKLKNINEKTKPFAQALMNYVNDREKSNFGWLQGEKYQEKLYSATVLAYQLATCKTDEEYIAVYKDLQVAYVHVENSSELKEIYSQAILGIQSIVDQKKIIKEAIIPLNFEAIINNGVRKLREYADDRESSFSYKIKRSFGFFNNVNQNQSNAQGEVKEKFDYARTLNLELNGCKKIEDLINVFKNNHDFISNLKKNDPKSGLISIYEGIFNKAEKLYPEEMDSFKSQLSVATHSKK